jgi:sarcosine oxidase subunit beta
MYIDLPGRFYFRQELDGGFVLGLVEDDPARESDLANPETDWDFKTQAVEAAVHRVPNLAETSIANAWSGIVSFTPDQLPILGPVKEAKGLYLANGMSGYGVMISPGVGLALAEMIAYGESKTIDISNLGYERFQGQESVKGAGLWLSGP